MKVVQSGLDRVAIDKSGANLAGLQSVNVILKFTGAGRIIKILQVKYTASTPKPESSRVL